VHPTCRADRAVREERLGPDAQRVCHHVRLSAHVINLDNVQASCMAAERYKRQDLLIGLFLELSRSQS